MQTGQYRVERILKTKVVGSEVFYVVKWVGYDELSEEPETNPDIRALVDELWNERVYDLIKVKNGTQKQVSSRIT